MRLNINSATYLYILLINLSPSYAYANNPQISFLSCQVCHYQAGPDSDIPSIQGQTVENISEFFSFFGSNQSQTTIMHRFVQGYSQEELSALAKYISNLESNTK
jgi:cytochrome c553